MAPLHLEWNALDPEVACPPLVQGQYTEPVAPDKHSISDAANMLTYKF